MVYNFCLPIYIFWIHNCIKKTTLFHFRTIISVTAIGVPVFFTVFLKSEDRVFSFQNNPKILDPSYKMDLDLCDCLGWGKLVLQQNFIGLIELFVVFLERGKPCFIAE